MKRPDSTLGSYALVAGSAATWGTWSLFFRPAERAWKVAPAAEATVVLGTMAVVLAPLALRERPRRARPARAWALLGVHGVTDAMNALCFYAAMQRTSLAVAVLTHYLAPVLVALAAPLALREPGRRSTPVALALALGGLALLLEPWRAPSAGMAAGAALGAASAVFYAANVLLAKRLARDFAPSEIVAWHAIPAVPVLLAFVPAGGLALPLASYAWIGAGALLPGALAGLGFMRGLARIPASHASVLTLLEPLVAVVVGTFAWGERVGLAGAAGAALILGGAWVVLRAGERGR